MSRLVKGKTKRVMGQNGGTFYYGDCRRKDNLCVHLRWWLCPGWAPVGKPCKHTDMEKSGFSSCGNSTTTPEISHWCTSEGRARKREVNRVKESRKVHIPITAPPFNQ